MKYKRIKEYILIGATLFASGLNFQSCQDLDISPMNIIQDEEVFGTEEGIMSYMARLYSQMLIEDFRYSPDQGFNHFWLRIPLSTISGESLSLTAGQAIMEAGCWTEAYKLIRDVNYFMETLPEYTSLYEDIYIENLMGEARFIRAWTYYQLAKRYGGVPIVDKVINYPQVSIEDSQLPRNSEEETWDFISEDLDYAIRYMGETSVSGRGNRYVAAGLKSRAMLYAGSIAKYNSTMLFDDKTRARLCGISPDKATDYFTQSVEAAKLLESKYSLYMSGWKADDKKSQYENYVNLYFDESSPENILVKTYNYPESAHGYDAYCVPRQFVGPSGYSCRNCPTVEFVEMFDGIEKDENGQLKTLDENGNYILFNSTMEYFENAEPRLRGRLSFLAITLEAKVLKSGGEYIPVV
ncbi:MAG: RagB/SusD family nutrient uptake outer membrane protein [Tannerellaceae bacterium]|nr:RagB/SusD family nutrient uptake outer membrane protein [Tannerellaceae bacterium]